MICKECKQDKPPSEFPQEGKSRLFGQVCRACYGKGIQQLTFAIAEADYENQLPPYFED